MSIRLSQRNAEQIVFEINKIINNKINVMNSNGIIIASSDISRIGTFHEGAKKIIDEGLDELIINDNDSYIGSYPGINYPLIVNNQTIGVLGITGYGDGTLYYAKIIKKMTEMLIQELIRRDEEDTNENIKNLFLNKWLNEADKQYSKEFISWGKEIGIDITKKRRFMAMANYITNDKHDLSNYRDIEAADKYLQKLYTIERDGIMYKSQSYSVLILNECSDTHMLKVATNLKELIEIKFNVKLAIGIDESTPDYFNAYESSIKAHKALKANMRMHKWDIRFYRDITMEILSNDLTEKNKEEFICKIFNKMNKEETKEAIRILDAYYSEEGSLDKASKKLFIHKNTLQNKLKHIKEVTAYDPRSIRYSSLFYVAIYFYREIEQEIMMSYIP